MDISQYKNFITVVECGTITAAADKLNIAQPALSNQIKNLENEFGAELMQKGRGQREVHLTEAGQLFYRQAQAICRMHDDLHREIDECSRGISGTLKMSLSPSRSPTMIRNFVVQFHKDYPQVKFVLREDSIDDLERHVLSGLSEIAVANAPLLRPHLFDILFRRRQQLYAVVNEESSWFKSGAKAVTVNDLAGVPLCLSGSRNLLTAVMEQEGLAPQILSENTTRTTALYWAKAGLGVAVVPFEQYDAVPYPGLVFLPVKHKNLFTYKTIFKLKGQPLSAVAKHFLDYYAANCYPDTEKF